MDELTTDGPRPSVVLLGDRGPGTRAVYHALDRAFGDRAVVSAVLEAPPSRVTLARRRARRLGWVTVTGQVAFVGVLLPALRRVGRPRVRQIAGQAGLDFRPIERAVLVDSVNDDRTLVILEQSGPSVVVVHGTRLIADRIFDSLGVPFLNVHAGVTPRYRGVHGGYWALAEGCPRLAGTTVHLIDSGIDTGGILGQATFEPTGRDTVATYPYLQLACGLPVLVDRVAEVLAGRSPAVVAPLAGAEPSRLRWHPTAWGYLATWARRGVR